MAVSDIFKYQHAYNTNGTFDDKSDWKTAFDIANGFSDAYNKNAVSLDNMRKYYENQASSANRVDNMNASFIADTAKQNYDYRNWQAKQQVADITGKYGYQDGRLLSPEEIYNLAIQNGDKINPQAKMLMNDATKNYLLASGQQVAPIDPSLASAFSVQSGSPWLLKSDGMVVNMNSGQEVGKLPANIDPAMFSTGNGYSAHTAELKAAQKVAEAEQKLQNQVAIAEARANAQAEARIKSYENYREHQADVANSKQADAVSKLFDGEKGVLNLSMDYDANGIGTVNPQRFEHVVNNMLIAYPQYAPQIKERAAQVVRQYSLRPAQ